MNSSAYIVAKVESFINKPKQVILPDNVKEIKNITNLILAEEYEKVTKENIALLLTVTEAGLNITEKEVLSFLVDSSKHTLNTLKSSRPYAEEVAKKINAYFINLENEKHKYDKHYELINTVKNNQYITDLSLVKEVLASKADLTLNDKIDFYEMVSKYNSSVFDYNTLETENIDDYLQNADEEDIIDENTLENYDYKPQKIKDVINIFKKYGNGVDLSRSESNEKNMQNSAINRICKYANLEKVESTIDWLHENKLLNELLKHLEVLSYIIIHSSINDLENMKNELRTFYGDNYYDYMLRHPECLYPRIKVETVPKVIGYSGGHIPLDHIKEGGLINGVNNIKYFRTMGISEVEIKKMIDKNSKILSYSTDSLINKYAILKDLYGIGLTYGPNKKCHISSSFDLKNLLFLNIEVALECDGFDYLLEYFSRCKGNIKESCLFYRLKLANKLGINPYNNSGTINAATLSGIPESNAKIERMYNAIKPYEYSKIGLSEEEYNMIVEKINTNINQLLYKVAEHHPVLNFLDEHYIDETDGNNFVYNFNGVRIARTKVLRFLSSAMLDKKFEINEKVIFVILTYMSLLTEAEMDNVYGTLHLAYKSIGGYDK